MRSSFRDSRLFSRLRERGESVRLIRGTSLAAADVSAFAVAFGSAGVLAWFWGLTISRLPLTAAHLESASFHDAALLAGVMLYFARRGHYASRLPFWSALQNILTGSIVALLCDGFLQFQFHRPQSRMLLGLTWVFFPAAVLMFRAVARGILGKFGLWELRTVVIGSGQAARQAEAALLSEFGAGLFGRRSCSDVGHRSRIGNVLEHYSASASGRAADPGVRPAGFR